MLEAALLSLRRRSKALAISCTFCIHHLPFSAHCQPYIFFSLPKHHEVANAVGAAIASVSGDVDTIEILEDRSLSDVLENVKQRAVDKAAESGAQSGSVRIADINVLPVQVRDFLLVCVKQTCLKNCAVCYK